MSPNKSKNQKKRDKTRKMLSREILEKLEKYKEDFNSWDEVAGSLRLHKKTIMRWRKSKKISWSYIELLRIHLKKVRIYD